MKHISQLLGLTLVLSALVISGCKKKPVRDQSMLPATGGSSSTFAVDPDAVAVNPDGLDLENRDGMGMMDDVDVSVVEPVYFAFDRSAVAAAERPKIEAAVKWLAANPGKNLVLVGRCDWRGTAEYNLGLGDRRANAVKNYLQSLGVSPGRIETLSKGSIDAKQDGSESSWAKDRRVDFIELKKM